MFLMIVPSQNVKLLMCSINVQCSLFVTNIFKTIDVNDDAIQMTVVDSQRTVSRSP